MVFIYFFVLFYNNIFPMQTKSRFAIVKKMFLIYNVLDYENNEVQYV